MKINDHIYIWIIFGVIVGFVIFLSLKEFGRKEKDIFDKNKACLPGTYVSTFVEEQNKQYIVCRRLDGTHFAKQY